MRYYGTIIRWNENRNFGAIREESTENEIFVQLSAFSGNPTAPFEGQRVSFHITKGRRSRDEAHDVRFADEFEGFVFDTDTPPITRHSEPSRAGGVVLAVLLGAAVIGGGAWYGWQAWQNHQAKAAAQAANPVSMVEEVAEQMKTERKAWKEAVKSPASAKSSAKFSCDGRQYCSQMNSREEAEFFIRHCPNTKMDSDNDGIPCENDSRW